MQMLLKVTTSHNNRMMKTLIILLLCILISCNSETVLYEYTPEVLSTQPETHEVNIVVDNQAENVIFETNSVILYYRDIDICKTFNTYDYYLDSVILNGKIYTPHYTIYNGNIHIPIKKGIPDSINYIDVLLYDGCPWYSDSGNRILQSIQFVDPEVEDWIDN